MMAVDGLVDLLEGSEQIRRQVNPELRVRVVLPCRLDIGRVPVKRCRALARHLGAAVFTTVIRENVRLAEATAFASDHGCLPQERRRPGLSALALELEARGVDMPPRREVGHDRWTFTA